MNELKSFPSFHMTQIEMMNIIDHENEHTLTHT